MSKKNLISPLILMLLALCLLLVPGEIITTAIQIIGLIILVASLTYVIISVKHKMTNIVLLTPVITTILGLLMVLYPKSVIGIIPLMVGLWILGKSLFKLNIILAMKKSKDKNWIKLAIVTTITTILGLILVFNPFKAVEFMLRIIALIILFYSILDIINYFLSKPKEVKVIRK